MGKGIVYIVKNDAFKDDLIKIGATKNLTQRLNDLSGSNVPQPYICLYACEVNNHREVEKLLHKNFSDFHYTKEFFKANPEPMINLLKGLGFKDITKAVEKEIDEKVTNVKMKVKIVNNKSEIPDGYYPYEELKKYLAVKPNFYYGYFAIRVGATHTNKKVPYYKLKNVMYYNKEVFLGQAKIEGILSKDKTS